MQVHKKGLCLSLGSSAKYNIIGNSYKFIMSFDDHLSSFVPLSCFTELGRWATVNSQPYVAADLFEFS